MYKRQHLDIVFGVLQKGLVLLKPFIMGGAMAFIMNVLLRMVEEKLFAPLNRKNYAWWNRSRRVVCVILTIGLLIGLIFILLFMIVPEIARTGRMIAAQLPGQLEQFFAWAQSWLASLQIPVDVFRNINIDWNKVVNIVTDSIKNGGSAVFNTTVGITSSIVGGVMNLVLATVFSIYLLLQKEQLGMQLKNAMLAFLPSYREMCIRDRRYCFRGNILRCTGNRHWRNRIYYRYDWLSGGVDGSVLLRSDRYPNLRCV